MEGDYTHNAPLHEAAFVSRVEILLKRREDCEMGVQCSRFGSQNSTEEASMAQGTPADFVRQASTMSILWGVLLIICGLLAIASPYVAAVAVNVVIAWLLVVAGALHIFVAFQAFKAGTMLWKLLVGVAYVAAGVYMVMQPQLGVASLTLLLASLFLVEGLLAIILFFQIRSLGGSAWVLVDGIVTLLLGGMIYMQWPASSAWAIGTLVGVSMFMSGVSRVMMSTAVRKTMAATA
jgi:uncharacterized membrane protein HdeD (DUF308 family)